MRYFIAVIFLCNLGMALNAQQATTAAGGDLSGSGGSVSYTIGQIDYINASGGGNIITQGVQQPYEIFLISEIAEANGIQLNCNAYPNPTTDLLKLNIKNYDLSNLSFQIFDLNGKLLTEGKITSAESSISLEDFKQAVYFLKIIDNNNVIKSFKINKII